MDLHGDFEYVEGVQNVPVFSEPSHAVDLSPTLKSGIQIHGRDLIFSSFQSLLLDVWDLFDNDRQDTLQRLIDDHVIENESQSQYCPHSPTGKNFSATIPDEQPVGNPCPHLNSYGSLEDLPTIGGNYSLVSEGSLECVKAVNKAFEGPYRLSYDPPLPTVPLMFWTESDFGLIKEIVRLFPFAFPYIVKLPMAEFPETSQERFLELECDFRNSLTLLNYLSNDPMVLLTENKKYEHFRALGMDTRFLSLAQDTSYVSPINESTHPNLIESIKYELQFPPLESQKQELEKNLSSSSVNQKKQIKIQHQIHDCSFEELAIAAVSQLCPDNSLKFWNKCEQTVTPALLKRIFFSKSGVWSGRRREINRFCNSSQNVFRNRSPQVHVLQQALPSTQPTKNGIGMHLSKTKRQLKNIRKSRNTLPKLIMEGNY